MTQHSMTRDARYGAGFLAANLAVPGLAAWTLPLAPHPLRLVLFWCAVALVAFLNGALWLRFPRWRPLTLAIALANLAATAALGVLALLPKLPLLAWLVFG